MAQFILEEQARNAIIDYLSQRPYSEVAQAINALMQLKKIDEFNQVNPLSPLNEMDHPSMPPGKLGEVK